MIPATLVFERAGRVEVEFSVDAPVGMDHSRMDHGAAGNPPSATGHGLGAGHGATHGAGQTD
jgi:hypothetical protein